MKTAQAIVHQLLEGDAEEGKKDELMSVGTHCPECGSTNVSAIDREGLVDCFNCGIWFDPLDHRNQ